MVEKERISTKFAMSVKLPSNNMYSALVSGSASSTTPIFRFFSKRLFPMLSDLIRQIFVNEPTEIIRCNEDALCMLGIIETICLDYYKLQ